MSKAVYNPRDEEFISTKSYPKTTPMSKSKRWKPKIGVMYWCVDVDHSAKSTHHLNRNSDESRFRLGNCFQTKKEAQDVARKLKGFWKSVREGKG